MRPLLAEPRLASEIFVYVELEEVESDRSRGLPGRVEGEPVVLRPNADEAFKTKQSAMPKTTDLMRGWSEPYLPSFIIGGEKPIKRWS